MQEKPEGKVPWPKSEEELLTYIKEMAAWPDKAADQGEGYGRCVYAMSNAALATFNYVAGVLGVTGFQAGCAEMQFVSDSRDMRHGFILLDADNLLYPQYDLRKRVDEWIKETEPKLAEAARELLAKSGTTAHPNVVNRWAILAAQK